ncbi:MAG: N-dimethylarginine dimethylaminohydrolase [Cyclobacteriaceae bacterium]|jgi:N-dimethylarginine dimethylaminohydrolase
MIPIQVLDETAPLEAVVLGIGNEFGGTPDPAFAYDPKSLQHIKEGVFPKESDIVTEMSAFSEVLLKYNVKVYRPENIFGLNQVFSRDIGMVIGDQFIVPHILDEREKEIEGIRYIINQIPEKSRLTVDESARLEGGDIMPYNGKIFAGYSEEPDFQQYKVSRTNGAAIDFLTKSFPDWDVQAYQLKKSDVDPFENALHLDCCFQPIGEDMAIMYRGGFKYEEDADRLMAQFGTDKVIEVTKQEMYAMNSNVFSISPKVVVSEKSFTRLNQEMRQRGLIVEEISYFEISKMEGLLRCSTLPLKRSYV